MVEVCGEGMEPLIIMATSLERANVAARDLVGGLEQRVGGKKRLYVIGGVVGAAVLLLLFRACQSGQKPPPPPPPRPVAVAKVVQKEVPLYLDEIGTCAAYETVQVQAQISGQIIARNFQDGADVKKGDLLFTIDPRPFQAALDQAKAQAALDEVTLKRQQELRTKNV